MTQHWTQRAGTRFATEKRPAVGSKGMVVTNHPLASAAGAEMLAAGGNAVDAAIASLFTLTVVEPMMVGIVGGGGVTEFGSRAGTEPFPPAGGAAPIRTLFISRAVRLG